jgi:hypothetical protein
MNQLDWLVLAMIVQKYSEKFNTMFDFYLKIYRTGLIDFVVEVILTLMLMVQRESMLSESMITGDLN